MTIDKFVATIFKGYKAAVDMYGHPICIRLDYTTEHILVQEDQKHRHIDVIKPILTSLSMHNHVILNLICNAFHLISNLDLV